MLHGRNLKVYKDGQVIACARSCEISADADLKEIASASSSSAKSYKKGRYGWKVSVSGLVASFPDIATALKQVKDGEVSLMFCASGELMTGKALCTSVKVTGTLGNLVQLSATFQGSGELYGPMLPFRTTRDDSGITFEEGMPTGDLDFSNILFGSDSGMFFVQVKIRKGSSFVFRNYRTWPMSLEVLGSDLYNSVDVCKDGDYYCLGTQKIVTIEDGEIISES